jgi:hypothetical protein
MNIINIVGALNGRFTAKEIKINIGSQELKIIN